MRKINITGMVMTFVTVWSICGLMSCAYDSTKEKYPHYTRPDTNWEICVAQTDENLSGMTERERDDRKITMVEAKYFVITEKYDCKLLRVYTTTEFDFALHLPHGKWEEFTVDPLNMAKGFKEKAESFDQDEWVKSQKKKAKDYSDVPDEAGLKEDAEYYVETLKKIAEELSAAEKQPDMGLVSLQFIRYTAISEYVDNAKLKYDIEKMAEEQKN